MEAHELLNQIDRFPSPTQSPVDAAAGTTTASTTAAAEPPLPVDSRDTSHSPLTDLLQGLDEDAASSLIFDASPSSAAASPPPPAMPPKSMRGLVWFRRDLRIHDALALDRALKHVPQGMTLIPFCIVHRPKIMLCGVNRMQFLLESISSLAESIAARGSRLIIARGDALDVLRCVLPAWGITHLFMDNLSEPFAIARDVHVRELAQQFQIKVETTSGYTLYDLDAVLREHGGRPPKTYTSFLRCVATLPQPPAPLEPPETLPAPEFPPSDLYQQIVDYCQAQLQRETEDRDSLDCTDELLTTCQRVIAGPEQRFTIPDVAEFGFNLADSHSFIYGGETIALNILREFCKNEGRVVKFEKPKTSPAETQPSSSTTSLSPYLYFGCISPRKFLHHVREIQMRHRNAASAPPVSLDGQLLWREFFHCHGRANPYFDKMEENPICLQIDWRYHIIPEDDSELTEDERLARAQFEAWKEGQTGYPWIDAIMIQLKREGWMHHLARHSVACFLTRGDLYISWIRGLEVFQERLIDHDWSINAGNWLWLSSSAFFAAYYRVYSPSTFAKKWDPEGKYIKKYIPALEHMPVKYIYEPWKAPMTVQRAANCLIGKDYPFPIVDHKMAMGRCMSGMKTSYAKGERGIVPDENDSPSPIPLGKRSRGESDGSEGDASSLY